MKKRIITGMLISAVLASSVFAGSMHKKDDNHKGNFKKYHMMKQGKKMPFFSTLREVYLSSQQKDEIKKIMAGHKIKASTNDAFTSTSFDKSKYISLVKAKKENMLEERANLIEKVYAVLNTKQKEELKKRLDDKKERMLSRHNKRLNNDKDING
ncbi:MAG: hypothetical protein COA66_10970 [Arcobacter sp.]|nr:MAG: hypothetical protein COA66_10970 [Arcobacter sp.]